MIGTVRRTTPLDARALQRFCCSDGSWYQDEVERLVRESLALRVAAGFGAWVVDDGTAIRAVAAHEAHDHPARPGERVTYLLVIAVHVGDRDNWARNAGLLALLLRAVFADVETQDRAPYLYARVAAENLAMRRFLDRSGFTSSPIPSDPRYLFYLVRLGPPYA